MALEIALAENTAALKELTAQLKASGGKAAAAPAAGKGAASPAAAAGKKSKHSREDMQAALNEVKEKFGAATAREVITEGCGAETKMAAIPDTKIDAVYDLAKAKMTAEEGSGEGDDGL